MDALHKGYLINSFIRVAFTQTAIINRPRKPSRHMQSLSSMDLSTDIWSEMLF